MVRTGDIVTEMFDYDDGRQVTVYVPPDPPEAIVFAGDGQMIAPWGGHLAAANVPSTMIVGVHRVSDETLRLHEYSPNFDPPRFAAHQRFFVEKSSSMGAVAFQGFFTRDAHGGVWRFGRRRTCAGCPVHNSREESDAKTFFPRRRRRPQRRHRRARS